MNPSATPTTPLRDRILWRPQDLASVTGINIKTILAYDLQEILPCPIRLRTGRNSLVGWLADEIHDWFKAGCPRRVDWKWKPRILPSLETQLIQIKNDIKDAKRELDEVLRELREARKQL